MLIWTLKVCNSSQSYDSQDEMLQHLEQETPQHTLHLHLYARMRRSRRGGTAAKYQEGTRAEQYSKRQPDGEKDTLEEAKDHCHDCSHAAPR